jgi:hypothetical protein
MQKKIFWAIFFWWNGKMNDEKKKQYEFAHKAEPFFWLDIFHRSRKFMPDKIIMIWAFDVIPDAII